MAGWSYSGWSAAPGRYMYSAPERYMYSLYRSSMDRFQGLRGLPNYRLSCCVNALLQSLSATRELLPLLNCWTGDLRASEKANNVPEHLQKALQAMQGDTALPDPHQGFLRCLDRNHIPMSVQHDADEVFLSILNLIQEQMSDTELAQRIKRLYMVEVEEHLQCNECTFSQSGETYLLSLPLPLLHKAGNTLEECFRAFFELQELDNAEKCFCQRCGKKNPSKQGFKLIYLPPVLCLHLKRFRFDNGYTKKLHCKVSFPQALDFKTMLQPEQISKLSKQPQSEWRYELYAVIVHSGSAIFGHYTAYIKHEGDWYYADDSHVSKTTWAAVEGTFGGYHGDGTAYMLLYRRTEREREPECSG